MTGSDALAERKSAVGGGAAEADADGDRMVVPPFACSPQRTPYRDENVRSGRLADPLDLGAMGAAMDAAAKVAASPRQVQFVLRQSVR